MDRVTRSDVDRIANSVSQTLRGVSVVASSRNGYTALDRYDSAGLVDTLHVGTKRECYTYLQGMLRYSAIVGRSYQTVDEAISEIFDTEGN